MATNYELNEEIEQLKKLMKFREDAISPENFALCMKEACVYKDIAIAHGDADQLVESTLRDLGYTEGADIYRDACESFWYTGNDEYNDSDEKLDKREAELQIVCKWLWDERIPCPNNIYKIKWDAGTRAQKKYKLPRQIFDKQFIEDFHAAERLCSQEKAFKIACDKVGL